MNHKSILIELTLMAAVLMVAYLLFGQFDVLERIIDWSQRYEQYEIDEIISTSIVFVCLLLIFSVQRWRESVKRQHLIGTQNRKLQMALDEIKQLKGILPLCSFCKKVRDDSGYWEQVDVYLDTHSNADISHSICPDCFEEHYPEEPGDMP